MSIFASKTPRDLNPHGVIMTGAGTLPLCLCGWQRRRLDGPTLAEHIAEFDHVQHNAPNPILVAFREHNTEAARTDSWKVPASPEDWIKYTEKAYIGPSEHTYHARRVLARLANLSVSKEN